KLNGFSDKDAVSRALKRSLAQAGVSAAGGSLLPIRIGGDLTTVLTQSAIQGLAGYVSGYAGAEAINEDYTSTEGALNLLFGAVTALPEVALVGGLNINKAVLKSSLNDSIVDRAIANVASQQELQDTRSVYFGSAIRELLNRVKSSKTNQISPETIKDFIKSAQNDEMDAPTEAYIDVESFNQLATEYNIDTASIFEMAPELSRDYQRVNDIDGLIRVPIDELLTAFSKIDNEQYLNAFADSLRYHPEALTAGEARAEFAKTSADMKSDIQQIKSDFKKENETLNQLQTVSDIIWRDLSNLKNSFSADYNNNAKSLVSAFYESLSEKTGISAADLYQLMPLRIVSNEAEAAAINGSNSDSFNQKADTDINNLTPTIEQNKYGDVFQVGDNGFSVLHGSPNKSLDINSIEIIRQGQKQAKKNRNYGGLYSTLVKDIAQAENYAKMGDDSVGSIYNINLKPSTKILKKEGDITRLSENFINEQIANGIGAIYGTDPRGRTEIAIIDKNAIQSFKNKDDAIDSFNQQIIKNIDKEVLLLNKNEFQSHIKEKYSINLGLIEDKSNNSIEIQKIIVPDDDRNSGTGTKAMSEIIAYADANNKTITLTPSSDFGGNKKRLTEFYKRFGFIENKGKNKDSDFSDTMYRKPLVIESFNQSSDPQVELRKIYGYRDSHLAPDAEGGVSGSQITDAFPELNDRSFTKNYGDGFKYDTKTVKIIREMQKNPEGE
ncbi:MAG: hypothetical protein WBP35_01840, partial [Lactococcus chungangensis]